MGGMEQDLLVLTSPRPQKHPAKKGRGKMLLLEIYHRGCWYSVGQDGEGTAGSGFLNLFHTEA